MVEVSCPTCSYRFLFDKENPVTVRSCPSCGLTLDCSKNIVPSASPEGPPVFESIGSGWTIQQISIVVGLVSSLLLFLYLNASGGRPRASNPAASEPSDYSSTTDDPIDQFVDQQVEENWRPIPGGNSKEDAKTLTGDILRARNQEELEAALLKNHLEGR